MESLVGVLFVVIIVGAIPFVFGRIGIAIARNNQVSEGSGFWYGFWLGPIGLVIVALLKPIPKSKPVQKLGIFSGDREISNDAYKIYLTQKYNIQKNDVLESYVCDSKLFTSVDEALVYARDVDKESYFAESIKTNNAERLLSEQIAKQDKNADIFARFFIGLVIGAIILIIILAIYDA